VTEHVRAAADKAAKFTDDQIAAAQAAVAALPGRKKNPGQVKTKLFWSKPDDMPTIRDVDFRDITSTSVAIGTLLASTRSLDRARLDWHVQHPGQPRNPSVFTTQPLVLNDPDQGQIIIDGHHRLAALSILGVKKTPVFLLPVK